MPGPMTRREALKQISTASAGVALAGGIIRGQTADIVIGGRPVEIVVSSLSPAIVRINVLPIVDSTPSAVPDNGGVAQPDAATRVGAGRAADTFKPVRAGNLRVRLPRSHPRFTSRRPPACLCSG